VTVRIAFAADIVALAAGILLSRRGSLPNRVVLVLLVASVGVGFAGRDIATYGYLACAVGALLAVAWAQIDRRFEARRWWARAVDPIVLRSPFAQPWYVVAGGADPRHNHHQAVSDQYFAYDFLCEDGPSWDREILAPCDGSIAWTQERSDDAPPEQSRRDRKTPAGNYVSIETGRGFVILAHLRKGSIAVRVGSPIRAGEPIGRCGNSGNTRGAHLHVHAQDRAQVAVDVARGLPIAFLDERGQAQVLEYGDVLSPQSVSPVESQ